MILLIRLAFRIVVIHMWNPYGKDSKGYEITFSDFLMIAVLFKDSEYSYDKELKMV